MNDRADTQLLRDFAAHGDEAAFREIVARYADLVYSAALRQVESSAVAGDIAQGVFIDLARKAGALTRGGGSLPPSLAGWLHRATRYAALNYLRDTRRRLTNERQAMEQLLTNSESAADWEHIRPALDEALDCLGDEEREALLLRYFKNQDFRAVGLALGVSDDAAQKRVSRAVERLRELFAKRDVTIGASGLAVLISANAVQSAPVGLAIAISTAALAGTVTTSTAIAITKTIAMTTLQKTLMIATVAALAGTGVYESHHASRLRSQVEALQQQQEPLAGQVEQLQRERDEATSRLAAFAGTGASPKHDNYEVLKLRGEVGALRQQLAAQRPATTGQPNPAPRLAMAASTDSPGPDVAGQLAAAIEQGDTGALGKLNEYAMAQSDFFNTNSTGLIGDELTAVWTKSFSGILSAFDSLADAAVKGNANARRAIEQAAQSSALEGPAVMALGKLAGAGDANSLEILLNPGKYGLLESPTVSALQPAADSGNQRAIAALVAILSDENKKAFWHMASQGLRKAAAAGDPVAVAALKSMPSQP